MANLKLNLQNKKTLEIIGIILLLLMFPLLLLVVRYTQDIRSSAAAPDKLETEAGVLSSSGVAKKSDSGASGGQYIEFNKQSTSPSPTTPPNSGNSATAKITVGTKQQTGYEVSFDGMGSTGYGPYGATDKYGIKTYFWNFGDGSPTQSSMYYGIHTHKYTNSGNYTVTLTVEDYKGSVNSTITTINVGSLPVAQVNGGNVAAAVSSLNGQPGIVRIPSGSYTLSSNVTLPTGVILEGAGKTSTKLTMNGYKISTGGNNIRITGIEFAGARVRSSGWLVHYNYKNLLVDNNDWHEFDYATGISNATTYFLSNNIHDNDVSGGDSYGIQTARDSYFLARNNVMYRNRHDVAAGGESGTYISYPNGYDLISNEFRYDPQYATIDAAIDMHPTGHGRIRIVDNLIENVSYGIGLKDGWGEITGNTFKNIRSWAMKFGCNTHNGNVIESAGVFNMNVHDNTYTSVGSQVVIVYGFNITVDGQTYTYTTCQE